MIKLNTLKPNPNNPRLVKNDKFRKLVDSIQQFGEKMMPIRPIIIDENRIILAGNMRYKALKHLKIKEVDDSWVKQISNLTEEEKKEFIIKDNVGFGAWDWDILANEWDNEELDKWGLDIPDFEVELEAVEDDYEQPEEMQVDVVLGDLIEIGEHRLLCGDSTCSDTVARLMNGCYPDFIHTDPPYGMNAVSKSGVLSKNYDSDIMGDDNSDIAKEAFTLIYSLYPNANQVWWGANYYCSVLPDSECWLVWDKNNGQSDQTDCELAWANFRSVVRQFTQVSEKTNRVHPTQKPVSLVFWIMERFKLSSKTIADFLGGSGVTMVATHQMGKVSYLMELDPKYCQVIINRMQQLDSTLVVKINGKVYEAQEVLI